MPQIPVEHKVFKGLLPPIDRKRVDEPFVVDGENFIMSIDGPGSLLGRKWYFNKQIAQPKGIQTLRNCDNTDVSYFVADAICAYDENSRQFYHVFKHTTRQTFWPWTRARVGNRTYYANKEIGLVQLETSTQQWEIINDSATNLPATVYAVAESGGRLVVLGVPTGGNARVYYSEIDNGTDAGFAPDISTGAGSQGLSMLGGDIQPLTVLSYEAGFLTYTTDGILRSQLTDSAIPFRHRPFSRKHIALNAWSVVKIFNIEEEKEEHVLLTKRGLFATDGQSLPKTWQGIMSEYLHETILPNIPTGHDFMTTRLASNFDEGWFIISIAENGTDSQYSKAYIFHLNEWGSYNRAHTGFCELRLQQTNYNRFKLGIIDVEGSAFDFEGSDSDKLYPTDHIWLVDHKTHFDIPAERSIVSGSDVNIMPTLMQFNTDDITKITDAGVYNLQKPIACPISPETMPEFVEQGTEDDSGTTIFLDFINMQTEMQHIKVAQTPFEDKPLNSFVMLGPFVYPQERSIDFVSSLEEALLSMFESNPSTIFEDYIGDYIDIDITEDYNISTEANEDYGQQAGSFTEYNLQFIGTLDGYQVWNVNNIKQDIVPSLVQQTGRNRHVAGSCSGAYIFIKINATAIGETFLLKQLRLTMAQAGRLF